MLISESLKFPCFAFVCCFLLAVQFSMVTFGLHSGSVLTLVVCHTLQYVSNIDFFLIYRLFFDMIVVLRQLKS